MDGFPPTTARLLALALACALTLLGLFGLFGPMPGYTDALFEPDFTIRHTPAEGPLAEAGFRPGDSVIAVEGTPVVVLGMYSRWPRSLARAPGESLTLVVERDGERVSGEVVFRPQPRGAWELRFGTLLVFLAFLWAGVWAYLTVPSAHAARLCGVGMAAGFTLPWPEMGGWNGIRDHVHMAAMVLWTLLLLRFFLSFPKPRRVAESHLITAVIYAPWVVFLGCLVVELIFHPRFYHSFGGFGGLLMAVYMVLTVVALLYGRAMTTREEAKASGLAPALWGFGIGAGGILLWAVNALVFMGSGIPGANWGPVLFGAIPLGTAWGVRRAALREE